MLTAKNYSNIGARLHLAPIYDQTNNFMSITINTFENEQPHYKNVYENIKMFMKI